MNTVISGTGLYTPATAISNEALVEAFNTYVDRYNQRYAEAIAVGEREAKAYSSCEFIVKASGIRSRYVVTGEGILDPEVMAPRLPERRDDELSVQAEMAVAAAQQALAAANKSAAEVDAIVVACAYLQRAYPAVAIEVQDALGCAGFAFDMTVGCAAAVFAIQTAQNMLLSGQAGCVLVINPEVSSANVNFRDRDSHFIFGDACTALVIEREDLCQVAHPFRILGTRLVTQYSNSIRNNFGFLNRTCPQTQQADDKLFVQQGRRVFKEVVPAVVDLIQTHLAELRLEAASIRRFWLHQANINMNTLIVKKLLGREATPDEAPMVLDQYANTSSPAAVIAFHQYHQDIAPGELGLLCAFGAGYALGNVLLQRQALAQ